MTLEVSIGELLKTLERKITFHREQASLHAREEELHRGQRTLHETELESATRHFEALKAAAGPAAEIAMSGYDPAPAEPPQADQEDLDLGANPSLAALIKRVLKDKPQGESFGPTSLAAEINQRFRDHPKQKNDVRNVSAALRRMHRKGQIELAREGRSYHEAVYRK
jgi:hypothetical protein